jgi:hypothetical protein
LCVIYVLLFYVVLSRHIFGLHSWREIDVADSSANPNILELQKAYQGGWKPTLKFIQWASEQFDTPYETETSLLASELQLKSRDSAELFSGIKELGLATFIVGRRGSPSRLSWKYTLPSIAAVATGLSDIFEPVSVNSLAKPTQRQEFLKYLFQLRRDLKVEFALPADLTLEDVERLSAFLKTLPLNDKAES